MPSSLPPLRQTGRNARGAVLALTVSISVSAAAPAAEWVPGPAGDDLPPQAIAGDDVGFDRILEGAAAILDAYDLPALDMQALALSFGLGGGADAAFAFVRDEIRTEPYAGSLRAPGAVLAAGGGNAQDKAELLVALFQMLGYDARVASGPLAPGAARPDPAAICAAAPAGDPFAPSLAGFSAPALARAQARAKADYARLRAALDAVAASAAPAPAAAGGGTHYRVQMRGPEGWTDYDPAMPGAQPGQSFAAATAFASGGEAPHRVEFALSTETVEAGRLKETRVLTFTGEARALAGRPIHLAFAPVAPGTGGVLTEKLGAISGGAAGVVPLLLVDGTAVKGTAFGLPQDGVGAGQALLGAATGPALSALWLDVASVGPDGRRIAARRALLDRVPAAARAAGRLAEAELRPLAMGASYPVEIEALRHFVVSNGGLDPREAAVDTFLTLLDLPDVLDAAEEGALNPEYALWLSWTDLRAMALFSESVTRQSRLPDGAGCPYIGMARVYAASMALDAGGALVESFDWLLDSVDAAGARGADTRLWHGAVQSALETADGEAMAMEPGELQSTSLLLAGALQSIDPDPGKVADIMALRDAEAGYVLLATPEAAADGLPAWWRVDPETGRADARLAQTGNGWKKYINDLRTRFFNRSGAVDLSYMERQRAQEQMRSASRGYLDRRQALIDAERARRGLKPRPPVRPSVGGTDYAILLTAVAIVAVTAVATYRYVLDQKLERARLRLQNTVLSGSE